MVKRTILILFLIFKIGRLIITYFYGSLKTQFTNTSEPNFLNIDFMEYCVNFSDADCSFCQKSWQDLPMINITQECVSRMFEQYAKSKEAQKRRLSTRCNHFKCAIIFSTKNNATSA